MPIVALALVVGLYLLLHDSTPPAVTMTPNSGPVGAHTEFELRIDDKGAGVAAVKVTATQNGNTMTLTDDKLPENPKTWTKTLTLPPKAFKEGPLTVEVYARDNAFGLLGSNKTDLTLPFTLELRPPTISVLSLHHNVNQGGCGLVVFNSDKPLRKAGVQVGQDFFPAHLQPDGRYFALFAFPYYLERKDFLPRVSVVDMAGNARTAGIYFQVIPKVFRHDNINISDMFLESKAPEFQQFFPDIQDKVEIFLRVNNELRQKNSETLITLGQQTGDKALWDGPFLRMENAAPRAGFGDVRSYIYQGKKIDQQTHLGQDLASVQQATIHAGNNGVIVLAEYFGIFGNCVIIDHGLGLQSMYAHLSRIDVKKGDTVTRGQPIALSGATGMAGGDHLHYGMYLDGIPVQPIEWWDAHWIRDNITSKMDGKESAAGRSYQPEKAAEQTEKPAPAAKAAPAKPAVRAAVKPAPAKPEAKKGH